MPANPTESTLSNTYTEATMLNLLGYTLITNEQYCHQREVNNYLGRQLAESRKLVESLRAQIQDQDGERKDLVEESCFYREQYGRAFRIIEAFGQVTASGLSALEKVETEFLGADIPSTEGDYNVI